MTVSGDTILATIADDSFLADLGLKEVGLDQHLQDACDRLVDAMTEVVRHNAEQYELVADQLEENGLRDLRQLIGPAVRRDMRDYHPDGAAAVDRGRERLYWLAVALADRTADGADVDLRAVLCRTSAATQLLYRPFYRRLLELTGREPIAGTDDAALGRLQALITMLLEGETVARRAGSSVVEDDVVAAAMVLFWAFTTRPGEPPFDPEEAITGASRPELISSAGAIVTQDDLSSYRLAIEAIRGLTDEPRGILRHASFHGLSGVARTSDSRPAHVEELRDATVHLLDRGWKLQRLVTLFTVDDLDREVAIARELATHGHVRIHATVGGVGGHAATILADGKFVVIGLDDPDRGYVEKAVRVDEPAVIEFWKEHFQQVFSDHRHTFVIWDPGGERHDHIAQLRARVRGLERVLGTHYAPVHLTRRQEDVIDCLKDDPHATAQEMAARLFIDRETVKKHLREIYDAYGIPSGRDRRGPLIDLLRRRGQID